MKLYAIGDIHGCLNTFNELLDKVFEDIGDDEAEVVLLGDYTDRGPYSFEVVERIIGLLDSNPKVKFTPIRGNHDQMFIDACKGRDLQTFLYNGGKETVESYTRNGKEPTFHLDFFNSLPHTHRVGEFFFVHAGIDPYVHLDEQSDWDLIWCRDYNNYNGVYPENVFVVHGHTPVPNVHKRENQMNIDTGCVFRMFYPNETDNGLLTAVRLDGRKNFKFIQVPFNDWPDGRKREE